jgi:hypothetical protein
MLFAFDTYLSQENEALIIYLYRYIEDPNPFLLIVGSPTAKHV